MNGASQTRILSGFNNIRIWIRLVASIVTAAVVMWAGFLTWANHEQEQLAVEQAKDFAVSIHQMTMAGLTGMMLTGTVGARSLFLDQINKTNHIEGLKVFRSPAVVKQFGIGKEGEMATDPADIAVLETGASHFSVITKETPSGPAKRLRAILPALALEDSLGKNCLVCHHVPAGTVLGAVSMEISLDRADASARTFSRDAGLVAMLLLAPLALFIWYFISRIVTRPLRQLTSGLEHIAEENIEQARELPRRGNDEIGQATLAFNRVMEKTRELLRQQRLSQIVFENALEGITVTDAKARIQMVNKAFTDTTGFTLAEVAGQTPAILKSGKMPDDFYAEFWATLRDTGEWRGEIWNKRKNGTIYPEWLNVSAVRDKQGEVEHYIAIFSDITERKQKEELIAFQAFHDALTGLPNRTLFRDRLEQTLALARRHKYRTPAIMFLDLDRFKQINDTLGHDAGDSLLKEVAARLRRCVRETDTVARMGGDEFTVLLPEVTNVDDARAVAEKIIESMRQPTVLAGQEVSITTSIGVSIFPRDGRDPDTLMKHADTAMYHVKGTGRAGVAFFAPELLGKPSRRHELESRLVSALAKREFVIHYQPIVDLRTTAVVGVEALLRWQDADGSLLLPEDFIGIAEDLDLMREVGTWVLNESCRLAAHWRALGHPLFMAVNLSPRQFHRVEIVDQVRHALQTSGLDPHYLQLEISEGLAMRDIDFTLRTLSTLHSSGVRIAVDDYGTGYFNLTQLSQLSLGYVKLDRSLVRDATQGLHNKIIASALMQSATTLGFEVVAEGIETEEQLALMASLNCHYGQGYLFGKAVPADEMEVLLNNDMTALGRS